MQTCDKQKFGKQKMGHGGHLVFQNDTKNVNRQSYMITKLSCKFEKPSYNIFVLRGIRKTQRNACGGHLVFLKCGQIYPKAFLKW